MRTVGAVGQLYPTQVLDYENPTHRQGFRFMVQVAGQVSEVEAGQERDECRGRQGPGEFRGSNKVKIMK